MESWRIILGQELRIDTTSYGSMISGQKTISCH